MIQRIQTLYIFIGTFFLVIGFFFLPYLSCFEKLYQFYVLNNWFSVSFFSILCLLAIFSFNNKRIQIKLIYFISALSSLIILFTVFTFPDEFEIIKCDFNLLVLPILLAGKCCYYLAIKSIKKDEDLINSIHRLR